MNRTEAAYERLAQTVKDMIAQSDRQGKGYEYLPRNVRYRLITNLNQIDVAKRYEPFEDTVPIVPVDEDNDVYELGSWYVVDTGGPPVTYKSTQTIRENVFIERADFINLIPEDDLQLIVYLSDGTTVSGSWSKDER